MYYVAGLLHSSIGIMFYVAGLLHSSIGIMYYVSGLTQLSIGIMYYAYCIPSSLLLQIELGITLFLHI